MEITVPTYNLDPLQVTHNLKKYLQGAFDFVYDYNNFFIVANNDTPNDSLANTTGELIWLKMIDYCKDLMINPTSVTGSSFYSKVGANFILAYGSNSYLKDQYTIILSNFNRKIVPIYNISKLDYSYLNNDIKITKLDSLIWKPVGFLGNYNTILESVIKLIFDTLNLLYPTDWSFKKLDNLYIILNRDVINGYNIPVTYDISIALKNYIYQVWIFVINNRSELLSSDQKKVMDLLYKYKDKGIPLTISNDLKNIYDLKKNIIYTETTSLFSNEFFNKYIDNTVLFGIVAILLFILFIVILKIFKFF